MMRHTEKTMIRSIIITIGIMELLLGCKIGNFDFSSVAAVMETDPVHNSGDAADDSCIWIHPDDPSQSIIIATDKQEGLAVYDLEGNELQYISLGKYNNVDIRYGFLLDGVLCDIIAATNRTTNTFDIFIIDDDTGLIDDTPVGIIDANFDVYGVCMYKSPLDSKFYCYINSMEGIVKQWELVANGSVIEAIVRRTFFVGSLAEGCVADDDLGYFYIAEEDIGIWRYGAEPSDGNYRVGIDMVYDNRCLQADIEGLALYRSYNGEGYLIASIQGNDSYALYSRKQNKYIGSFKIKEGTVIDGVSQTDGIEVLNTSLNTTFSFGMFIAQDYTNTNPVAYQNFKMVKWDDIANLFDPPLIIETEFDIR